MFRFSLAVVHRNRTCSRLLEFSESDSAKNLNGRLANSSSSPQTDLGDLARSP